MPSSTSRPKAAGGTPYRAEIDGLRAVAILSVLMFHAQLGPKGAGYIGVDIFFVISGYLITSIVWEDLEAERFSFTSFYLRRIRRIFPALFVIVLLSSFFAYLYMPPTALREFGGHAVAATAFFANVAYYLQADYFATQSKYLPLIHTWSLSIEEQYYLVVPLLLRAVHRGKAPLNTVIYAMGAIALISLGVAERLSGASEHRDAAFYLLPSRAWELAVGALCALAQARFPELERMRLTNVGWLARVSDLGLAVCVASVFLFNDQTRHPGLITALPVIASGAILLGATPRGPTARVLSSRPLVGLGLISYSVYLIHQPILALLRIDLARELKPYEAALALICAVGLGAASWKWVEQPFRRINGGGSRFVLGYFAGGSAVLLSIGAIFYLTHGLPSRVSAQLNALYGRVNEGWEQRRKGVRLGRCHYNRNAKPFERFFGEWDCLPKSSPKIITLGDSISADKSWVLREAGYDVGNLGGAGCPLTPPTNPAEPCAMIIGRGRELLAHGQVDALVFGQNWRGAVSNADLGAIVDYWGPWASRILVFTAMPSFDNFPGNLASYVERGLPPEDIPYDRSAALENEASLGALQAAGFTVINSRRLLCGSDDDKCGAFVGEVPRVGDPVHLQPLGVKLMAERIRNDPTWLAWFRATAARAGGNRQ